MFDKNQKSCVKHIHLVTDECLYDQKAFYTVKTVFYTSSIDSNLFYRHATTVFDLFRKKEKLLHFSLATLKRASETLKNIDCCEFRIPENQNILEK